jgi:class 3 adenylate cyclase
MSGPHLGCVQRSFDVGQARRALRVEPRVRLQSIDAICQEILNDAGWERLADSEDPLPGEFRELLGEIRGLCEKGLCFLQTAFTDSSSGEESDVDAINKSVHDFKNLIAGITYRCQYLREHRNSRLLPWSGDLESIQQQFAGMIAALDAARGVAAKLPAHAATEPCAAPPTETVVAEPTASPLREDGRILVVDDEEDGRQHLARELQKHGHQVTAVGDGAQALHLLEQACYTPGSEEFDLVLLDLRMRDKDGIEVLRELKRDYGLRSIPVVMVSANDDIDSVVQCVAEGADDYLTKPFEPRLLQARVGSCLVKRKLQKQQRVLIERIQSARQRANELLYHIFPYTVAEELITSGAVKPRGCDHVAVMFCDVVGFTAYCGQRSPDEVVAQLHELFTAYEAAVRRHHVEKIKTIGDAMMISAGLMQQFANPVLACLRCGVEMIEAARQCSAQWEVRIGIHIGPVVAGMAGNEHYAFDVWGDTVNTASRVEGTAEPGTIHLTEPAWAQVYSCCKGKSLGIRPLKGKQSMELFRFEGFRDLPPEVRR